MHGSPLSLQLGRVLGLLIFFLVSEYNTCNGGEQLNIQGERSTTVTNKYH